MKHSAITVFAATVMAPVANAYWLMGINNFITTERLDPIVNPGQVAGHVHSILGGSNFGFNITTDKLLKSQCTSIPIVEDKSNYWFPHLYYQWANGSFTSVDGAAVIYYLFDDKPGTTTAFPPNFRMLSGNPMLRTYDKDNFGQQAVSFLCLDFNNKIGGTTRHEYLPQKKCPDGIRAQINFQSCWDGKNVDSPDHQSHVAYKSEGPDAGSCKDPKYPVTLPRIFLEVYWGSNRFNDIVSQAKNPEQPFVFAHGDPTGYGYHADFYNGWEPGVLQRAVDGCTCNIYGDPTCCVEKGLFTLEKERKCFITKSIDEQTTGTLRVLPGNNPVQAEGTKATMYKDTSTPGIISPVFVYTQEGKPTATGKVVTQSIATGAVAALSFAPPNLGASPSVSHSASVSSSSALAVAVSSLSSFSSLANSPTSSSAVAVSTVPSSTRPSIIVSSSSSAAATASTDKEKACSRKGDRKHKHQHYQHHGKRGIYHNFDNTIMF